MVKMMVSDQVVYAGFPWLDRRLDGHLVLGPDITLVKLRIQENLHASPIG